MGKRELLLVIAFAVVGVVVYQLTAPPPPPGSQGFSVGALIQHMRRGIQGNRAVAELDRTHVEPVDADVQELRFLLRPTELTLEGEDRTDAEIHMHVTSHAFDDAEAKRTADATALSVTRAGNALVFAINYPREGLQRAKLSLKVPKRLRLRLEPMGGGKLDVTNLASIEVMGVSGDTSIKRVSGLVTLNHRSGSLAIDGAGSLKLTTRGGDTKIQNVEGVITIQAYGGEISLSDITGPAEIEARNTDVRMEGLKMLKAPLRLDLTNGSVRIAGLRTEGRIDGRDTKIDVAFDAAAAMTIYNTSDDISITPPSGGYSLDAVATDGRISVGDSTLKPEGNDAEQRVNGAIRGGGPLLTVRATRGDINVRAAARH
jgi:hypothetical protein